MKKRYLRIFTMCMFLILLALSSFLVGFVICDGINSKLGKSNSTNPVIRIIPDDIKDENDIPKKVYNNIAC